MRFIHIISQISEEAAGASYSVRRLCESLIAERQDLALAVLDWAPMASPPPFMKSFPLGVGPRRLGRSPEMKQWFLEQARSQSVDLIHNHGLWMMPNVYSCWVSRKHNIPLIISPRGNFSEWAMRHGSKIKKVFWPLVQKPALDATTCFHATAESEYEDIRRMGFKQPVAIIPNGIDIPPPKPRSHSEVRKLLFLGRIHPVKGVDILLNAWQAVQRRFPEWRLIIVGSDGGYNGSSGYLGELRVLAERLRLQRIEFVGELRGTAKLQAYQEADLFVLPSHSENFGLTVAEALAAGTPAIVSKGAPWRRLEQQGAGWWIDIGLDPLVACLDEALSRAPDALDKMGQNGRSWMESEFSWAHVGQRMMETYRWPTQSTTVSFDWVRVD